MLAANQTLDRYTVLDLLGQGGMAVVYRLRHNQLDTLHALKVLTLTQRSVKERLIQEGRVQAQLRHPNIVSVTDVLSIEGAPGLLMEYVAGPSLEGWLERAHRATFPEIEALFRGVVDGVAAAHAHGLVHRDLKPANVMVARAGGQLVPKVADFGLAKIFAEEEEQGGRKRTRTGVAMGTPAYMAPEQIRSAKDVDQRADIFSLGCIFYEMLTRRNAFDGDDLPSIFQAVLGGKYEGPRSLLPTLPARYERAILGCLERDRERRIPDCATLLRVLSGEIWTPSAPEIPSGTWTGSGMSFASGAFDAAASGAAPSPGASSSGGADSAASLGGSADSGAFSGGSADSGAFSGGSADSGAFSGGGADSGASSGGSADSGAFSGGSLAATGAPSAEPAAAASGSWTGKGGADSGRFESAPEDLDDVPWPPVGGISFSEESLEAARPGDTKPLPTVDELPKKETLGESLLGTLQGPNAEAAAAAAIAAAAAAMQPAVVRVEGPRMWPLYATLGAGFMGLAALIVLRSTPVRDVVYQYVEQASPAVAQAVLGPPPEPKVERPPAPRPAVAAAPAAPKAPQATMAEDGTPAVNITLMVPAGTPGAVEAPPPAAPPAPGAAPAPGEAPAPAPKQVEAKVTFDEPTGDDAVKVALMSTEELAALPNDKLPPGMGAVVVTGDAVEVKLATQVDGQESEVSPGLVLAGSYKVRARFNGSPSMRGAGDIVVPVGKKVEIHCDAAFQTCRKR